MARKEVVETVYGKYRIYDIIKTSGTFSTSISVQKDGKHVASFKSVRAAVEWAEKQARKSGA